MCTASCCQVWFQWNEMHRAACSQKENESKASLHLILGLKRKAFHQWTSYVSCCQAKKELEGQYISPASHHLNNLWAHLQYMHIELLIYTLSVNVHLLFVVRTFDLALAVHACSLSLLRMCWNKWCSALYQKRREEDCLEAAGHLATRSTQRRALERWKACILIHAQNKCSFPFSYLPQIRTCGILSAYLANALFDSWAPQ